MKLPNNITALLSGLMSEYGITHVVGCPGSRNMPLLTAFGRNDKLHLDMVIDERSAAFSALGIAEITGKPVAIVCTSGSALLNFAPAVAEAYYRRIPLLVISADRPASWIDQNDGQTLRQPGVLDNVVKRSIAVSDDTSLADRCQYYNRLINEALHELTYPCCGPVHLNVHLSEPLKPCPADVIGMPHDKISLSVHRTDLPEREIESLWNILRRKKVMIFVGQSSPDENLDRALNRLSELDNIVIVADNVSNLRGNNFIRGIDAILSEATDDELKRISPDIVITSGSGPISRIFKEYIRKSDYVEHWDVVPDLRFQDSYRHLTRTIIAGQTEFFMQLSQTAASADISSDYKQSWQTLRSRASSSIEEYVGMIPWCDLKAVSAICKAVPSDWNIQCSNGMLVRYTNLFDCSGFNRFSSNRGVNGIEGSTSTAVGASGVFRGITLLLSGDMSAYYDAAGLISPFLNSRFKMIVFDNSGGDIFRCIKATKEVPERETLLSCDMKFPGEQLAALAGMLFLSATDEKSLEVSFDKLVREVDRPAMLVVRTSKEVNSKIFIEFINRKKL